MTKKEIKTRNERWGEAMRKQFPYFANASQHAFFLAGMTKIDGLIDTCTEYGMIENKPISKKSTIL